MAEKRLISEQRYKDEGLHFAEIQWVREDGVKCVDYRITDKDGQVYDAILHDHGGVDDGWTKFDSQETFEDRKSTRLNSSHVRISYAVFCLKKKKQNKK